MLPLIRSWWPFLPVRRRLPDGSAATAVGLSFDDGPSPHTTPALLALLARHRATATFFLTGERAARHPDLVRAVVEGGHDVFQHGWRHVPYAREPARILWNDLDRCEALLARLRPSPSPYLLRLPYLSGRRSALVHRRLRAWRADCEIAFWRFGFDDFRIADGCLDRASLAARCKAAAAPVLARRDLPGAILLLHEDPYDTIAPLAPAVAPMLAEVVLHGLDARNLVATALRPPSPTATPLA